MYTSEGTACFFFRYAGIIKIIKNFTDFYFYIYNFLSYYDNDDIKKRGKNIKG